MSLWGQTPLFPYLVRLAACKRSRPQARYRGMPRLPRPRIANIPMHVIQRGVNRAACFRGSSDFRMYLQLLEELAEERCCAIHAYVLMTNHVHLLLTPCDPAGCSLLMKDLGQRYSQHCNRTWGRTGPLWDGRFKSSLVDTDSYLFACHRYIEMNPVRAGMVAHPSQYGWSSYRFNALGQQSSLLSPHQLYRSMGRDLAACRVAYRLLFDGHEHDAELRVIREAARRGAPLGPQAFLDRLARESGCKVGRKYKRARTAMVRRGV